MAIDKRAALGEEVCSACAGTGLAKVRQPIEPGRRVYPPKCAKCGGKGRVTKVRPRPARVSRAGITRRS